MVKVIQVDDIPDEPFHWEEGIILTGDTFMYLSKGIVRVWRTFETPSGSEAVSLERQNEDGTWSKMGSTYAVELTSPAYRRIDPVNG